MRRDGEMGATQDRGRDGKVMRRYKTPGEEGRTVENTQNEENQCLLNEE